MDSIVANSIMQMGAVGILIIVLLALLFTNERRSVQSSKEHRIEREEWRKQAATQHNEVVDIAKNSNTILAEIKTMVEGYRK